MNKIQSHLTNAIIGSIVRKIDYWLNQLNTNKDDPTTFYECRNFIWDISDLDTKPGLTINHPKQITKIWWTNDTDEKEAEFSTNLEFSAEENLSFYIELEQIMLNDIKELENQLRDEIKLSFNKTHQLPFSDQ